MLTDLYVKLLIGLSKIFSKNISCYISVYPCDYVVLWLVSLRLCEYILICLIYYNKYVINNIWPGPITSDYSTESFIAFFQYILL